jgi:ribosomal-protein-alanine N-acetyltransferase
MAADLLIRTDTSAAAVTDAPSEGSSDGAWPARLPVLRGRRAILREVLSGDAAALAGALGTSEVLRYLPPGPTNPEQFARFIRWVRRERRAGRYLSYAVVPRDRGTAAGLFQMWPIEPGFGTAEMGFALDPAFWGSGLFTDSAALAVRFAFETLGVRRLEFRSAVGNGRGNGALAKLGAVPEGTLRQCFPCTSGVLDHTMWSLLASEWRGRGLDSHQGLS